MEQRSVRGASDQTGDNQASDLRPGMFRTVDAEGLAKTTVLTKSAEGLTSCADLAQVDAADLQAIAIDHHKVRYSRISLENGFNARLATFWTADLSNQESIARCRQTVCFST